MDSGNQDAREVLSMLLASCEKIKAYMSWKGEQEDPSCTMVKNWDSRHPAIYYMERNMELAQEVLERLGV